MAKFLTLEGLTYFYSKLKGVFVAKEAGKGLSSNDFTNADKAKLDKITENATTLAGYGITDAKIEAGTVTLGANSITPLTAESDLAADKITGTISLDNLPQGALERCVVVADDAARLALTTAEIQKGDTVKVTATDKMYFVVDDTKLNTEEGYEVYTAGSATSVPWSGVTDKPNEFTPAAHTHEAADVNGLAAVATTGSFNDLTDTPEILADAVAITNEEIDAILAA